METTKMDFLNKQVAGINGFHITVGIVVVAFLIWYFWLRK